MPSRQTGSNPPVAQDPSLAPPVEDNPPSGLEDLSRRVARLEKAFGDLMGGKAAEVSQEEKDRRTLSRRPNSYAEAVEYEAAQKRQAERDRKAGEDPAEGEKG